jgi:hypothetical protein
MVNGVLIQARSRVNQVKKLCILALGTSGKTLVSQDYNPHEAKGVGN